MLRQIVIGVAIGAVAYVLDTLLHRKHFRQAQARAAAVAVGREQSLPKPVRRVEGVLVTAGADVPKEGVIVDVRGEPSPSERGSFPAPEK